MRELVAKFRPFFLYAGLFSLAINLLLLVPPLYMLQVFDRVITSRSEETLLALTAAALLALGLMALLDVLRSRLLAAAGIALDRMLGPRVLDGLLSRLKATGFVHGLRDVNTLRGFLTGSAFTNKVLSTSGVGIQENVLSRISVQQKPALSELAFPPIFDDHHLKACKFL